MEIQVAIGCVVQVKDVTYCQYLLEKANEELYAALEADFGRSLTHTYLGMNLNFVYCVGLVNGETIVLEYSEP